MSNPEYINLAHVKFDNKPFPHFSGLAVLKTELANDLYDWLDNTDVWGLTKTDFYEQYEFNFLNVDLPSKIQYIVSDNLLHVISEKIKVEFNVPSLQLVGIAAHKLIDGQRIGIHNDFIDDEETHRFVIHLNPSWVEENGGILMLFNSHRVTDLSKVVHPVNNSAFAFEISQDSHHAVSKIHNYIRYTVIYTFKKI